MSYRRKAKTLIARRYVEAKLKQSTAAPLGSSVGLGSSFLIHLGAAPVPIVPLVHVCSAFVASS